MSITGKGKYFNSRINTSSLIESGLKNCSKKNEELELVMNNFFFGSFILKRWTGTEWMQADLKRWNGIEWIESNLKVWNGTEWVKVNF